MIGILRAFPILSLLAVLCCGSARAEPASGEAERFLYRLRSAGEQLEQIRHERGVASGELHQQELMVSHFIDQLKGPPPSDAKVKAMQSELEWRSVRSPALKNRIEELQQLIALSKITQPSERSAKKKEMEAEKAKLRERITAIELPFELRLKEAAKPIEGMSEGWAKLLSRYFKEPVAAQFSGLKKGQLRWQANNTGEVSWRTSGGERIYRAVIWLHTAPKSPRAGARMIEEKYEVSLQGKGIDVLCGYFSVSVIPETDELRRNEEALKELLKALVDMDALAALKPSMSAR